MSHNKDKKRLDVLLLERGLVDSRQRAKALVMAGKVLIDGDRADKPGRELTTDVVLSIKEDLPYVSRGGLKLEGALEAFPVDPKGLDILDVGASTGGFTDCLLQRGAKSVVALDVGYGQLHWRLRTDPRVTVLERTNIRHLNKETLPTRVQAATPWASGCPEVSHHAKRL